MMLSLLCMIYHDNISCMLLYLVNNGNNQIVLIIIDDKFFWGQSYINVAVLDGNVNITCRLSKDWEAYYNESRVELKRSSRLAVSWNVCCDDWPLESNWSSKDHSLFHTWWQYAFPELSGCSFDSQREWLYSTISSVHWDSRRHQKTMTLMAMTSMTWLPISILMYVFPALLQWFNICLLTVGYLVEPTECSLFQLLQSSCVYQSRLGPIYCCWSDFYWLSLGVHCECASQCASSGHRWLPKLANIALTFAWVTLTPAPIMPTHPLPMPIWTDGSGNMDHAYDLSSLVPTQFKSPMQSEIKKWWLLHFLATLDANKRCLCQQYWSWHLS